MAETPIMKGKKYKKAVRRILEYFSVAPPTAPVLREGSANRRRSHAGRSAYFQSLRGTHACSLRPRKM